jgi:hypothetical protein
MDPALGRSVTILLILVFSETLAPLAELYSSPAARPMEDYEFL